MPEIAKSTEDTRAPEELLDFIEAGGQRDGTGGIAGWTSN